MQETGANLVPTAVTKKPLPKGVAFLQTLLKSASIHVGAHIAPRGYTMLSITDDGQSRRIC